MEFSGNEYFPGKAKTSLAWNAGFGSKMSLNKKFDLDLVYKYVSLGKVKLSNASDEDVSCNPEKLSAHEVTLGLIYKF